MYCPNCNKEYEGKFCPECGTKLIEKPTVECGFNISLGDANAISGGIHLSDSHSVNNIDNSVHTNTTNNSTVNNITNNTSNVTNNTSNVTNITNNVAAQKTESEIIQERKVEFMGYVNAAFEDGILNRDEIEMLEKERIRIGLDEVTAKRLIETARKNVSNVKETLSPIQKIILKQIIQLIQKNDIEQIKRQLPRLEAIANNTLEERPQYLFYAATAAVNHRKLIEDFEALSADDYWQTFWVYIAYTKVGDFQKAEDVLCTLARYTQYSEENITLLSIVGALREFGKETAKDLLDTVTGMYSEFLNNFAMSIYLLIDPEIAKDFGADEEKCAFYTKNLLSFEDEESIALRVAEENQLAAEEASKLYNLRLNAPGNNSFKVVMVLKAELGITISEAKVLIDCCPVDIMKMETRKIITPLFDKLHLAGAQVEII